MIIGFITAHRYLMKSCAEQVSMFVRKEKTSSSFFIAKETHREVHEVLSDKKITEEI